VFENGFVQRLRGLFARIQFPGSRTYWERRYLGGGNSGAGSSGRLAEFKARTVNGFVAAHGIEKVVEFGCGDGRQLALADYPEYLGLDVSREALRSCSRRFRKDPAKTFLLYSGAYFDRVERFGAELALSLDVIFHLVEDAVFHRYMTDLFEAASRNVIIYSSNREGTGSEHVRHREFTRWVAMYAIGWRLREKIDNPFADFYIYDRVVSP